MPYTLVHPAFVLPLKKWKDRWFSNEALIIGSFVPDFDIIFRFTENRFHLYTFTVVNTLTVIFSASILTYLFYILFLKKQVDYILQIKHPEPVILNKAGEVMKILFSLLTAITVHIYLDSITHPDANDIYARLQQNDYPAFIQKHLYSICMYGTLVLSSLVGGLLLLYYIRSVKWLSIRLMFQQDRKYFWPLFLLFSALFFWLKVSYTGLEKGFQIDSLFLFSLSGLFYGFIVSCILFGFIRKKCKLK